MSGDDKGLGKFGFDLILVMYAFEVSSFMICQWLYAYTSYYNSREIGLMFKEDAGGAAAT